MQPLNDWGLNNPIGWLWSRFIDWYRYGTYPDGQGRDFQKKSLLDDFSTLQYMLNFHIQQEKPKAGR